MSRYVEVVGRGAATQPPDRLDLFLAVSAVRPDVGAAVKHLSEQVTRLGIALREQCGLTDADLRTTSSSVGEEYAGPNHTPAGFRASQDLQVRLADPDALSSVMTAAMTATGDDFRLSHLAWGITDETSLAEAARAAAFEDAKAKATQLATLAGAEVGTLLHVVENEGFGGGIVRAAALKSDAGFAAERGESRVEVSITARWALG